MDANSTSPKDGCSIAFSDGSVTQLRPDSDAMPYFVYGQTAPDPRLTSRISTLGTIDEKEAEEPHGSDSHYGSQETVKGLISWFSMMSANHKAHPVTFKSPEVTPHVTEGKQTSWKETREEEWQHDEWHEEGEEEDAEGEEEEWIEEEGVETWERDDVETPEPHSDPEKETKGAEKRGTAVFGLSSRPGIFGSSEATAWSGCTALQGQVSPHPTM